MSTGPGHRFLRAVRLDGSDTEVFERAAIPGEWAVPGSFAFWDTNPKQLVGKAKQAFHNGFLGTQSLGWTTLVEIDSISREELDAVRDTLTRYFVSHWGAPDYDSAQNVAKEEIDFAISLCDQPIHTLLAMSRDIESEGVVENFRVVPPPSALDHSQVRIWGLDDSED